MLSPGCIFGMVEDYYGRPRWERRLIIEGPLKLLTGRGARQVDVNSIPSFSAAMVMAVIGPAVFLVQPEWVKGLVLYAGFSDAQAGLIASAEMWGMCVATVAMSVVAPRVDWRSALAVSLLAVIAGNLLTLAISGSQAFAALRFGVGLGTGVIVSLSFTVVGLTAKPDRGFGFIMVWTLVYAALATSLMPFLYASAGVAGAVLFFTVLTACGLPFVRLLPASGGDQVRTAGAQRLGRGFIAVGLVALLAYFVGLGAVWAYISLIGIAGGLSEQQVANSVALAQFAGIAGALTAVALGSRYGRAAPLALGILAGVLSIWLMSQWSSVAMFGVAVVLFVYAWNVAHPYLLGAMASFDAAGRVVVYAVALQMLGLATGPMLGGAIISSGDYDAILWLGMALYATAVALILPPVLARGRVAEPDLS